MKAVNKLAILLFLFPLTSFASVEISQEEEQEWWHAFRLMRSPCKTEEERETVEKYIQSRSDINKKYSSTKKSLLHMAAAHAVSQTVLLLIQHKADVNQEDWDHWTPLMDLLVTAHSIDQDALARVKILLANGASLTLPEASGVTLAELLSECENNEVKKEIETALLKERDL